MKDVTSLIEHYNVLAFKIIMQNIISIKSEKTTNDLTSKLKGISNLFSYITKIIIRPSTRLKIIILAHYIIISNNRCIKKYFDINWTLI